MSRRSRRRATMAARDYAAGGTWITDPRDGQLARRLERRARERKARREAAKEDPRA